MTSTRRSLSRPSTPLNLTPRSATARHTPRSTSRTPAAQHNHRHNHHKTADELTLQEAEQMLQSPVASTSRVSPQRSGLSARDARHRHLEQVRAERQYELEEAGDVDGTNENRAVISGAREPGSSVEGESAAPATEGTEGDVAEDVVPTGNETATMVKLFAQHSPSHQVVPELVQKSTDEDSDPTVEDCSNGPSSLQSDSGSETSSTDESESDSPAETSESDDTDDENEHMEALLRAARDAAKAKSAAIKIDAQREKQEAEVVLQFDGTEGKYLGSKREAPIPDITISKLPAPRLSFHADGSANIPTQAPKVAHSASRESEGVLELDDLPYSRQLNKRERAAQPKKATASELWATIPAIKSDDLPQMKRDYQALALANSLDPKRFMKGGNKAGKVPQLFAIGTMVEQPRHLQDTTQQPERKYKPGQVVQGLVHDDAIGSYAKRKYDDLQDNRMENGRGRGWKKRTKW